MIDSVGHAEPALVAIDPAVFAEVLEADRALPKRFLLVGVLAYGTVQHQLLLGGFLDNF